MNFWVDKFADFNWICVFPFFSIERVVEIDDIEIIREYLSEEAFEDVKANFKDHTIIYDRLQESTLEEMNKKILIVGSGPRDTVILIDDLD